MLIYQSIDQLYDIAGWMTGSHYSLYWLIDRSIDRLIDRRSGWSVSRSRDWLIFTCDFIAHASIMTWCRTSNRPLSDIIWGQIRYLVLWSEYSGRTSWYPHPPTKPQTPTPSSPTVFTGPSASEAMVCKWCMSPCLPRGNSQKRKCRQDDSLGVHCSLAVFTLLYNQWGGPPHNFCWPPRWILSNLPPRCYLYPTDG